MVEINPLSNNARLYTHTNKKTKEQSFGNYYMPNYAPVPIYTQAPYGINQTNYIKLGVEKLPNGQELHIYKLSNGQKVEILKGDSNSSIVTQVGAGALDEKGFPKGIAHFIEHSMYHSSEKYHDVEHECNLISMSNNAATSDYSTKYYLNLATDSMQDLKRAIDIQSDMLLKPCFSEIDKEKNVVKSEIQDSENNEYKMLDSLIRKHVLNFDSALSADIAGTLESVDSITLDDMKRFCKKFYQPHNFNTVIATKHNPDDVIKYVAKSFMSKTPKEFNPIKKEYYIPNLSPKRLDIVSRESNIGSCEINFMVQSANNPQEKTKIEALIKLLKNRYDIQSGYLRLHGDLSQIYIDCGMLKDSSVEEKYQYIAQILREISLNPPSQEELEEIKKELKKDANNDLNGGNISQMLCVLNCFDDEKYTSINERMNLIDNLSQKDFVDVLKYFDLNKANIAAIHPKGTNPSDIAQQNKTFKPLNNPVLIPKNDSINNYFVTRHVENISGKKFDLVTLANNSRVIFVDSDDDECKIRWKLDSAMNYSSNPATKLLLSELPNKSNDSLRAIFVMQDEINFITDCKANELESTINRMKRFSNFTFTQKDFEKAKEKALENLETQQATYDDDLDEFSYGKKYAQNVEFLKSQIERMTLEDLINDFNNMILNSQSVILVQAPISKNPQLMNEIASHFDSPNFKFQVNESKTPQIPNNPQVMIRLDNASQNTILKQYSFPVSGNIKDKYVFKLLAEILAKKNFNLIREQQGLAYYSGANFEYKNYIGCINLTTDSSCKNEDDARKILDSYNANVSEMLHGQINKEEIILAKNQLKGNIASYFEDESKTAFCLMNEFDNIGELENISEINKIIDSITFEDIQKASKYVFSNKPKYFIDVTDDTLKQNEELFNSLGEVEKRINR